MHKFDIEIPGDRDDASRHLPLITQQAAIAGGAILFAAILIATSWQTLFPPSEFPSGKLITVPEGTSVGRIAQELHAANVIRSPKAFRLYTRVTGQDRSLSSGLYVFDKPLGLLGVARRLVRAEHGIEPARVTLAEGLTTREMAERLEAEISGFDAAAFLEQSSTSEGYLFPDTYFFLPDVTTEEVVTRMRARFDERVASAPELASSTRMTADLVIMASLLEREAQTLEDKRIIAGILWDRLDADMPLQVDAVFGYIYGKSGYAPTFADLEVDSPYNTYMYRGLPPGPIANPGLESLIAAATPTKTEYVYYLTGRDGNMYYARTFAEHRNNRALYLD